MSTDLARREPEAEPTNPFGAFAKVFSALADFFGNPAVQEAGRKLFADLDLDSDYELSPSSDPSRPFPVLSPPVDIAQLAAGKTEGSPERDTGS